MISVLASFPRRRHVTQDGGSIDGRGLAEAVRRACLTAALEAYEDASVRGLCPDGAWEAAIGAIRTVDLTGLATRSGRR
jgi:hypothetical protein